MTKLCIVGAGGHGAVVAEAAASAGHWRELFFLDKHVPKGGEVLGIPVQSAADEEAVYGSPGSEFIVAVGDNAVRATLTRRIEAAGGRLASVIHPSAVVSQSAQIAPGVVIMANAVINARTVVGKSCIINTAATVDHDCCLGEAVHVSPGAHVAGGVNLHARCWIGLGATVRQYITVGEGAIVGASAAVVDSVEPGVTVLGIPARPQR